jgi:tRNA pseudouridine38-40 synthase
LKYFLEISYNGSTFHGWQFQPNAITVQETIENALKTLLKEEIKIVGAGRTDTGVHAKHMCAHFDYSKEFELGELKNNLNSFLNQEIYIKDIYRVDKEAHARFSATSREYEYYISLVKDVFNYETSHFIQQDLNIEKMNQAISIIKDYEDFEAFSKSKTDVKTYLCNIISCSIIEKENILIFRIKANRFLRNMVRAIVGTILEVGLGKISPEEVQNIIKSKDRSKAGPSMPAHALFLTKIEYPSNIKL